MSVRILWAVMVVVLFSPRGSAEWATMDRDVHAIFSRLETIKPMKSGARYTLLAHGVSFTGQNDDFLRQRTASEISESKLSCGCGDNATVFLDQVTARGYEAMLVEGVQLSSVSLEQGFSGHVVVAMRSHETPESPWWLVDPTNRVILSRNWSIQSKSFESAGFVYWIGYCGSSENYSVHNGTQLREFYAKMLASVPVEAFNTTLYRFKFVVDPSLTDQQGEYLNPRLANLWRKQEEIFSQRGVNPAHTIAVTLVRGDENAGSDLVFDKSQGWIAHVGLKSGCSSSLLTYYEGVIRRSERFPTN